MIGNEHLDRLVTAASSNDVSVKVDWQGIGSLLKEQQVDPSEVVAASWCSFGEHNIEANVDSVALALVFPSGLLSTVGKRGMLSGSIKHSRIDFAQCKAMGPVEHADERGYGRYCIEFVGPGSVLLGRLQWGWRAKRFRDPRSEMMAAASERDRIEQVLSDLIG